MYFAIFLISLTIVFIVASIILNFVPTPDERAYAKDLKAWRDRNKDELSSFVEPEGYDLPATKPEYSNDSQNRSWVTPNSINDVREISEIEDSTLILSFDGKVVRSYPKDILIEIARKISQDPTVILEEGAQINRIDRVPPELEDYPGFFPPPIRQWELYHQYEIERPPYDHSDL